MLVCEFLLFLYDFLSKRCGTAPTTARRGPRPKRKPHRHRKLRSLKNRLKKIMAHHRKRNHHAEYAQARAEFSRVSRQLSLLNKFIRLNEQQAETIRAQLAFNKDQYKFAKRLFQPSTSSFSIDKEETEAHFQSAYSDNTRDFSFSPPPGLPRPPPPAYPFDEKFVSRAHFDKILKKKSSGSKPGPYGISYKVYKLFPSAAGKLFIQCARVRREKKPPSCWGHAYMIMLTKENRPTNHAEHLRNIACSDTAGKMFWSCELSKLGPFLTKNKYIDPTINKAAIPGVPGCLEHSFTLMEALQNAKRNKRQIAVTLTDIRNAYGSVKHNLIQFALAWYRVPDWFAETTFHYYESLIAFVVTDNWSTTPFRYGIGVFQGCVISMLFFVLIYQIIIDFIKIRGVMPFTFKTHVSPAPNLLQLAFADDHTLVNCSPRGSQYNIHLLETILAWTRCLFLRPDKCYSMALGDRRLYGGSAYSAFDPKLVVSGEAVKFLGDCLHKFLGRLISCDASDKGAYKCTVEFFMSALKIVDGTLVTGPSKAWIYQFYILAVLSWPFMVYPFSISNIKKDFEAPATLFLKKWYKLAKPANPAVLFLPKSLNGLGLTSPVEKFKTLQVGALHQLTNSSDPLVSDLAKSSSQRQAGSNRWKAGPALSSAESITEFNLAFGGQRGTAGLGFGSTSQRTKTSLRKKRSTVVAAVRSEHDAMRVAPLHDRPLSGNFLKWNDLAPSGINWSYQILSMSEAELSFILNAQAQSLPDPSNLRRWGCNVNGRCPLCSKPAVTAKHILSNCYVALRQGRYAWRHDNVLRAMAPDLRGLIAKVNRLPSPRARAIQARAIKFIAAGTIAPRRGRHESDSASVLKGARDWRIALDLDSKLIFPAITGVITALRPDIVIWSEATKTIVWGELTCPLEESILDAHVRKKHKYLSLEAECRVKGWTVHAFQFEVGSLGFVANSARRFLLTLGMNNPQLKFVIQRMSAASRRSSFHIWHSRRSSSWIGPPLTHRGLSSPPLSVAPPPAPLPPSSFPPPSCCPPAPLPPPSFPPPPPLHLHPHLPAPRPLPPPPFPPPFRLLPPHLRARIQANKLAARLRHKQVADHKQHVLSARIQANRQAALLRRRDSELRSRAHALGISDYMKRAAMPDNSLAVIRMQEVCAAHSISFDSLGLPIIGPPPTVTLSALPADLQELAAMMSI